MICNLLQIGSNKKVGEAEIITSSTFCLSLIHISRSNNICIWQQLKRWNRWNSKKSRSNSKIWKKTRKRKCNKTVSYTHINISNEKLHDIEKYKEFVERSEFQKKLLLDSFHNINDLYLKEIKNVQNAWKSSNEGWANYEGLCKKLKDKNITIE